MSENSATHPVKHGIRNTKWSRAGTWMRDPLKATIAVENGRIDRHTNT